MQAPLQREAFKNRKKKLLRIIWKLLCKRRLLCKERHLKIEKKNCSGLSANIGFMRLICKRRHNK
jgi:hypothetical protein